MWKEALSGKKKLWVKKYRIRADGALVSWRTARNTFSSNHIRRSNSDVRERTWVRSRQSRSQSPGVFFRVLVLTKWHVGSPRSIDRWGVRAWFGKMNRQFKEIGETFVRTYYELFDSNRAQLASFYVSVFSVTFFIAYRICTVGLTEYLITVTSKLSFRIFSGLPM